MEKCELCLWPKPDCQCTPKMTELASNAKSRYLIAMQDLRSLNSNRINWKHKDMPKPIQMIQFTAAVTYDDMIASLREFYIEELKLDMDTVDRWLADMKGYMDMPVNWKEPRERCLAEDMEFSDRHTE